MTVEDQTGVGDPNILAYKEDLEKGDYKDLGPDTHVIYFDGEFVATCSDSEFNEMIQKMAKEGKSGFFHTQPGKPRKVYKFRSPSQKRR